jgi:hypothetical protein
VLEGLATLPRAQGRQVIGIWTALRRARTLNAALAVLSMANTDTLRLIEAEFTLWPGPFDQLRERIAAAHLARVHGGDQMSNLSAVTDRIVLFWARDTLEEWLRGYTDYNEECGGQFRLRPLPHAEGTDLDHLVFEVEPVSGGTARRHFRVSLAVDEVDAK